MTKERQSTPLDAVYCTAIKLLASDEFFYGILALAALQALWYAFSSQPWINDEPRHFSNIIIYSHHWTPFLGKQIPAWDHLGEITRDGSFMFYYVMGWPLRLIRLFTQNATEQIIGLRLVCTAFFSAGLILYRRALIEAGQIPKSVLHLVFLFFVITPTVAILSGTVNYDNLVFLLFAAILLLSVRIVKSNRVSFFSLASLVIVSLFMSVVKWASIALLVPFALYLSYDLYKKHGLKTFHLLWQSVKKLPRYKTGLLVVGLIIAVGLFIERPVVNTIKYGNPEPSCQSVIGNTRCMNFPDYAYYKNIDAHKQVNFKPDNPVLYLLAFWEPRMTDTASNLLEKGGSTELPVITFLYEATALIGIALILVCLRDFLKNKRYMLLLTVMVVYVAILFLDEYKAYVAHGVPVEIRARYIIPVLPIFMYFVAISSIHLFGGYRKTLLISAFVLLLLSMQGGSIVTYLLTSPQQVYWQNNKVTSANNKLKHLLQPLVLERELFKNE